jgi:hypothetical protein
LIFGRPLSCLCSGPWWWCPWSPCPCPCPGCWRSRTWATAGQWLTKIPVLAFLINIRPLFYWFFRSLLMSLALLAASSSL